VWLLLIFNIYTMDETQVNPTATDDTTSVVEAGEVVVAPEAIEGEVVVEAEAPAAEEIVA
jgi:hypothetical protein